MKELLNLFREDNGNLSINRVIFAVGMLWVMYVTTYIVIYQGKHAEATTFFSVTAGIFTSLKLVQKGIEKYKFNQSETTVKESSSESPKNSHGTITY